MKLTCVLLLAAYQAALPFDDLDYRPVVDYDFEEITNTTSSARQCLDRLAVVGTLAENDPDCFGGVLVYAAAGTNGLLRISGSDNRGFLTYSGIGVSPDNTAFIRACRATNTTKGVKLSVDAVDGETSATNNLAQLECDCEMATYAIPLSRARGGDTLVFQPNDEKKTRRQFFIDRITFARKRKHGFYIIIR